MDAAQALRLARLVEAIEATITELQERKDPHLAALIAQLEQQRETLLAELDAPHLHIRD